jgi:hypothetical protein
MWYSRQKNAEAETIERKEGRCPSKPLLLLLLGDDHNLLPSNPFPPAPNIRKNPFSSSRHVFWPTAYNVSLKPRINVTFEFTYLSYEYNYSHKWSERKLAAIFLT